MSIAVRLQELRIRAGNPSIREIEHLIARQSRGRTMAQSTIQEKISGKSTANLAQILSIVEALAEHARFNGAPLPGQETDQGVWRERVTASHKQVSPKALLPAPSPQDKGDENPWNIAALMHAQMYDLIEIVESSQNSPTETWLPSVIGPMLKAQMSVSSFMERASQDDPQAIVRTLVVLNLSFPQPENDPWGITGSPWVVTDNNMTVGALLTHAARHQGAKSTPALVAGMRRAEIGSLVEVYLKALSRVQTAAGIHQALVLLRAASLDRDAISLLRFVGSERRSEEAIKIAERFHENGSNEDRDLILKGVSGESPYSLKAGLDVLVGHKLEEQFKLEILRGIPYGKHEEYAKTLAAAGCLEVAQTVREAENVPPF
ncbi:hypothetical protein [Streptomyces sp. NPDC005955]|uniref:hypothetical protein n=1 Tax=Streptomyces sp. NPDC005955 TaxID=3364738 RepID=UPI0036AC826A